MDKLRKHRELEEQMNSVRMAQKGDVIKCQGLTVVIGKINYNDRYVEWNGNEFGIYYDIEFLDTKGKYRHWKSYDDGGELILKN